MNTAAWLILLLPLFSAVVIGLGAFRSRKASAVISIGAVTGSFLLTLLLVAFGGELHPSVTWLAIGGLQIDIGLQIDQL
ncbi:MAG: NADH-quinone oxidoreductase subunit L, partial [Verrucomicrobia bacterium]|nr:NADH-quinone oxidoreductase subunit L [Verrucomicrobiota bacterium]